MEQNNNTFNSIKCMMDSLELYLDTDITQAELYQDAIYKLQDQFERAASAEWSKKELTDFIFDNDIIDYLNNNDGIYCDSFLEDVREIQHGIINFFGE